MARKRPATSPFRTPAAPAAPKPRGGALAAAGRMLAFAAANVLVCGLVALVSPILAMFVGVIVGMASLMTGELDDMGPAFTAFLVVATAGLLGGLSGLGELALWIPSGEISVAEAPSQRFATAYTFRDAATRPELSGSESQRGRRGGPGRAYRVMPLVPPGWTPADPVPAWAACSTPDCPPKTPSPRFGARVARMDVDAFEKAARAAAATHGLRVAPGAPLLQTGASAGDVVAERALVPAGATGVFALAWLVALAHARLRGPR